jgi:histidinol-phosphate aminotransferase
MLLVKMKDPKTIYNHLLSKKILVCDVSTMELCEGCLRITVGTKQENELLLNILRDH